MKALCVLTCMAIFLSMTGCSTLAQIVDTNFAFQSDSNLSQNAMADQSLESIQVYSSDPYTIHLELDESDSHRELEPLHGDGGASLNAYAACLTLKVIF